MSKKLSDESSFLFARPSFMEGVARILDFGNTLSQYNGSANPNEADAKAINSDWKSVGNDIREAEAKFKKDLEK